MNKEEKNKAIAEILGFKQYGITVNGKKDAIMAWEYPKEYRHLVCASPMYDCPDLYNKLRNMKEIFIVKNGKFQCH